jgi:hypothetical protein
MNGDLLTPAEAMAALRIKDRHTLDRLVARGRLERFNISGGEKQARWKYRLKALEPEPAEVSEEELLYLDLERRSSL